MATKKTTKGKGNIVFEVKIKDFTKDKDEPAYDVEVYYNDRFMDTYDGVISTADKPKRLQIIKALNYAINKLQGISKEITKGQYGEFKA